jgi:hypothetical protein
VITAFQIEHQSLLALRSMAIFTPGLTQVLCLQRLILRRKSIVQFHRHSADLRVAANLSKHSERTFTTWIVR